MMFRPVNLASQSTKGLQGRAYSTSAGGYTYQTTQLKNGLRVVSASSQNSPAASVGLYVNSGSRFETPKTLGAAGLLRRLAFKGNEEFNELRLAREFELLPGTLEVGVGKEQVIFHSEFPADKLSEALNLLSVASAPEGQGHVIRLTREDVELDTKSNEADPRSLLLDLLHREAYRYSGLGRSTFAPEHRIHHLEQENFVEFLNQSYNGRAATVIATGNFDHATLVKNIEEAFAGRQFGSSNTSTPSSYRGGEFKLFAETDTHIGLAFEGAARGSAEEHASALARLVLGGGKKLKDYGVGQGHTSRLYKSVVKGDNVKSVESFNLNYSDSGLFGVITTAAHGKTKQAVSDLIKGLASLKTSPVTEDELQKAKEAYKTETLFKTESRSGLSEFLSQQSGSPKSPSDFLSALEQVKAEDVNKFVRKATTSHPTFVAVGEELEDLPTPAEIQKHLH